MVSASAAFPILQAKWALHAAVVALPDDDTFDTWWYAIEVPPSSQVDLW